jgi:hypothetical protein
VRAEDGREKGRGRKEKGEKKSRIKEQDDVSSLKERDSWERGRGNGKILDPKL